MNRVTTPVQDAPTVDELDALKRLEMDDMELPEALHQHLSGRLLEQGYVDRNARGQFAITSKGRALIKRSNN